MDFLGFYLTEGFSHILDLNGYDHILFVACLCSGYQWQAWRTILALITAFTIGHSATLLLASLGYVVVSSYWVELLIAVSIFLTAAYNLLQLNFSFFRRTHFITKYFMAFFFGLIHGLGFSNFLKSMFSADASIWLPLLGFNLGIELGQFLIVALLLLLMFVITLHPKIQHKHWVVLLSSATLLISFLLILERI